MKKPFIPHNLPIKDLQWDKLIKLVGEANSNLSKYNGFLLNIKNPSLLLTTFAIKEAVLSSKIEGTQASLLDVLQKDSKKYDENKVLDIEEIENCKKALEYGIAELKNKPLCLNLIKDMHSILLNGVRGHDKDRGNFRKIQNFIGFVGATIEQASFIPPSPDIMQNALNEWEKYIHLESEEILIQLAVIHAQFETIHPFLDGNGRIGRILIPLFLYAKKYLDFPAFYMSEYLESCRSEYYARLKNISENNDWQGWIEFFLRAIIEQAKISYNRVDKLLRLYRNTQRMANDLTRSKYMLYIVDLLFHKPIIDASFIEDKINIDHSTAIRLLDLLSRKKPISLMTEEVNKMTEEEIYNMMPGIILQKYRGRGSRASSYEFVELLDIIENRV